MLISLFKFISGSQSTLRYLICLLIASHISLVSAKPNWQTDQYISSSFLEIALKREYNKKATPRFSRWSKPIKIYIQSDLEDQKLQKKMMRVQASHLQYITKHPISFVKLESKANLIITFTSSKKMKYHIQKRVKIKNIDRILKSALCLANFKTNSKSEITQGLVFIPVDYASQKGRLVDCMVEELTQLMGLPNDSDLVFPSIFNDLSIDNYLSGLDYLLLKIAYDPLLKPGMNKEEVKEQLPLILRKLHKGSDIENAETRVLKHSMRSWVNNQYLKAL